MKTEIHGQETAIDDGLYNNVTVTKVGTRRGVDVKQLQEGPNGELTTIAGDGYVNAFETTTPLTNGAVWDSANGSAGSCNAVFLSREAGGVFNARINEDLTDSLGYQEKFAGGLLMPEKTDLKWRVTNVSDNNTSVTASYEFIDFVEE